jgi:hypothetical protein
VGGKVSSERTSTGRQAAFASSSSFPSCVFGPWPLDMDMTALPNSIDNW